ncbi:MAG: hypothetical protein WDN50_17835 [Bradyrhizobium sp.]
MTAITDPDKIILAFAAACSTTHICVAALHQAFSLAQEDVERHLWEALR